MGITYKLLPDVTRYIVSRKHKNPEISCRKLAQEASEKFNVKISKSSVNSIIKKENLSSSVGRRPKLTINTDRALIYGGVFLLSGIDYFLGISSSAAKALLDTMPAPQKIEITDIENTIRCFILHQSLFDINIDTAALYNNIELWSLIGRRPTKKTYGIIVKMLHESQLFVDKLVTELRQELQAVSGFQFTLADQSKFFIDAQKESIFLTPKINNNFSSIYCRARSYINNFCDNNEPFLIFAAQGNSLISAEVFNLIEGFNASYGMRKLSSVEILDMENKTLERRFFQGAKTRFFLLGFWPWQLETMYELERNLARDQLNLRQLGLLYYYYVGETFITQPSMLEGVKLTAIVFKTSPSGPAKIGILSNIPKELIRNYLNIKYLYNWLYPEAKQELFSQLNRSQTSIGLLSDSFANSDFSDTEDAVFINKTIKMLSKIILIFFHNILLPEECRQWDHLKIKEVFLRQKAKVVYSKDIKVHNLFYDRTLCKKEHFIYICQRINNLGITEGGKLLWFQVKT